MTRLLELLVTGLSLGMLYSLVAMGFVVIFKGTRVVNFAQGSLLVLGAYVVARLAPSIGFWPAAAAGAAASVLAGALIRLLLSRARTDDPTAPAIATIGIDIVLTTDLTRRIGPDVLPMGDPWGSATVDLAGVTVPQARIAAMAAAVIVLGLLLVLFRHTNWGVSMRAASADPEAASLMGIRLSRVATVSWLIGGALAAVAGVFMSTFPSAGLDSNAGTIALAAVPAVILGGLDSTRGAVVGGLAVGVAKTLTAGYGDELSFLGDGFGDISPYVLMMIVLLWRPSGLFGTREFHRV
ncbi:branched-chain amino acid ABC transporter permease [Streptomyces sp. NPDC047081]|uniref:branched-chain amino acid ABC transporter permease n=1 Tax=Streptomyces sp. NPDC047081 TaxID=3154706 RepID=UPI0033F4061C